MRKTKTRILMIVVVTGLLLVPVLIWSGRGVTKQNDVVTIGTEPRPQQMTLAEKEAYSRRFMAESETRFGESPALPARPAVPAGAPGEYTGMTQTELDKIAHRQQTQRPANRTPLPLGDKKKPVSTMEEIPRAPGLEGMTPEERTKLEAYLKTRR